MAKSKIEEGVQEVNVSLEGQEATAIAVKIEEPVTNDVKEVPGQKVEKPTLMYIANNDTFVIQCPEGIEKVSGTFNGEEASGVVIDGIAHVKLSKSLPEEYTYTID
ncbi:hypothetical protein [Runella sp.]|uniref:hypothetical protein n=1 Tax=Runella sp. TaxID=1960881 RepID=UPI003D119562